VLQLVNKDFDSIKMHDTSVKIIDFISIIIFGEEYRLDFSSITTVCKIRYSPFC